MMPEKSKANPDADLTGVCATQGAVGNLGCVENLPDTAVVVTKMQLSGR